MKTFLFDVKLFAALNVRAETEGEARAKLERLLDCADANFGADDNGDPLIAEVSLDVDGCADLVEIDGEAV